MSIVLCDGSHGGINKVCESCAYNVEHHENFKGLAYEPPGKYVFLETDICRLPMGPNKEYWTQYKNMHQVN